MISLIRCISRDYFGCFGYFSVLRFDQISTTADQFFEGWPSCFKAVIRRLRWVQSFCFHDQETKGIPCGKNIEIYFDPQKRNLVVMNIPFLSHSAWPASVFLLDVVSVEKNVGRRVFLLGFAPGGFPILKVCSWDLRFGRRLIEPTTLPKN